MLSDVIDVTIDFEHSKDQVWEIVTAPEWYSRFFMGLESCLPVSESIPGALIARADGIDHAVRLDLDYVRTTMSITHLDSGGFVNVHLTEGSPGRCTVDVTVFKASLNGAYSPVPDRNGVVCDWLRAGFAHLADYLAGKPTSVLSGSGNSRTMQLDIAKTMYKTGVIRTARPDLAFRQLSSLSKWGFTLGGGFGAAAATSPDAIALIDDRGTRTFAEVHQRSHRIAAGLFAMGLRSGDTVGVLARNHIAMTECTVACGLLGVDVVLLNTGLAARQIESIADHHQLKALFADDEFDSIVSHVAQEVPRISLSSRSTVTGRRLLEQLVAPPSATFVRPEHPGTLVVLTSGTSGTPKGAFRPTAKGFGTIAAMLSKMPLQVNERMMIAAPLFHSWGLAALQLSTPLRSTVVLQDRFEPESCLQAIAENRCTSLIAVPIMLQRILELPADVRARYDTSSLRVVACSGSVLAGSMVARFMDTFGDVLYNFYGSTEVSWATVAGPADLRAAPTTAGKPPLGTLVAILDGGGDPVPRGSVGRIFVGNDMLFNGYTNGATPAITAGLGADMMDTGDLGYLDCNDRLFVCGRDDEMIISGGENVFPGPVEDAIAHLPQVGEVAVVGVSDKEYGQRLAAFVVMRGAAGLDDDMVRLYIRNRLSRFSVPRDVTFLDELPRTATGKVIKRLLIQSSPQAPLAT